MAMPGTLNLPLKVTKIEVVLQSDGRHRFVYTLSLQTPSPTNPVDVMVTAIRDLPDQYASGQNLTFTIVQ